MEPYLVKLEKEIDLIRTQTMAGQDAGLLAIAYAMIGLCQALENVSKRWKETKPKLWEGE